MPRPDPGPQLKLFGPDERFGAKKKRGLREYRWYVVWREKGERQERSTGAGSSGSPTVEARKAAEGYFSEFLKRYRRTATGPRDPDQITVSEVLEVYGELHGPTVADSDRIGYATVALVRHLGQDLISDISEPWSQEYVEAREDEGRTASTARRELVVLRSAINFCWRHKDLAAPVDVPMPDNAPARDLWFTRREIAILLLSARAEPMVRLTLPYFILISVYTCQRLRAVTHLQWQPNTVAGHVDIETGYINFEVAGRRTKKRRARQYAPDRLLIHLRNLRRRTSQYVLEWYRSKTLWSTKRAAYRGEPIDNPKKSYASACERAAVRCETLALKAPSLPEAQAYLASAAKFRAATQHTLRHTGITWLVSSGLPYADISEWARISVKMIEDVYGHHSPEQGRRVREAIQRRTNVAR